MIFTVLLIALGVSADAFAVALGKGLHMTRFNGRRAFAIAFTFGAFQAVMPLIGWFLGTRFAPYITEFDHWVAFGLLAIIGGRMIWEAFHSHDDDVDKDTFSVRELLLLGFATSIDALVVGVSLAFMAVSIPATIALIGLVTFACSYVGVWIGRRIGAKVGTPAEVLGGVILIGIGTQTLLEHLGVL